MKRLLVLALVTGCGPPSVIVAGPARTVTAVRDDRQDTAPKEELRLLPPEVYLRSYLSLLGATQPLDGETRLRGPAKDGGSLFDTWTDYLGALGLPDYKVDLPRAEKMNALMVAAFERLAVALCDRVVERELGPGAAPVAQRTIFAFDVPLTPLDAPGFALRFDVLHRTFLGYPARLAPPGRVDAFYKLYRDTVDRHRIPPLANGPAPRLSPEQLGWAVVCQGLMRHPELQLY